MIPVTVKTEGGEQVLEAAAGESLLAVLSRGGVPIAAPCGGRGACGKCRVKIETGRVAEVGPDTAGNVLACRARVCGPVTVRVQSAAGSGLTYFEPDEAFPAEGEAGLGVALDIGTTTLAAYLVELASGRVLAARSCLNPQAAFGADVLSRIARAAADGPELLQRPVLKSVEGLLAGFGGEGGCLRRLTVCGNTAMLHLFLGVDPAPLGAYPFTPVFTGERVLAGRELGLSVEEVVVLPAASAFLGGDLTAAVLASGMTESAAPSLLLDIGTNGEMTLFADGRSFGCSAAAGPAFEGAGISCGMGGLAGAIDRVRLAGGDLTCGTVEGAAPKGLCGSGLIDLIACLRLGGVLNESGAFRDYGEITSRALAERLAGELYIVERGVTLSQRDVRQVQLAKSAVAAGIKALLSRAGLKAAQLARVYLAGGFGFHLSPESAQIVGLFPACFSDKIVQLGNAAGRGAAACLMSRAARRACAKIAKSLETVSLADSPIFHDAFVANMAFPPLPADTV